MCCVVAARIPRCHKLTEAAEASCDHGGTIRGGGTRGGGVERESLAKMRGHIAVVVATHDITQRMYYGGVTRAQVTRLDRGRKHHWGGNGSASYGDALSAVCASMIWQRSANAMEITITAVESCG
jgi:hypothetical protein